MKKLKFVEVPTVPEIIHKRRSACSLFYTDYSELDASLFKLDYEKKICIEIDGKKGAQNIRSHINFLSTTTTRYSCTADYANGKMYIIKWKFEV